MDLLPNQCHVLVLLLGVHALVDLWLLPDPRTAQVLPTGRRSGSDLRRIRARLVLGPAAVAVATLLALLDVGGWLPAVIVFLGALAIRLVSLLRSRLSWGSYLGEQAANLGLLLTVVAATANVAGGRWLDTLAGIPLQVLALVTGLLFVWQTGAVAVGLLVRELPAVQQTEAGAPQAGQLIGRLERLLILALVLAGVPSGIGFLVAAKSVLRFGEVT